MLAKPDIVISMSVAKPALSPTNNNNQWASINCDIHLFIKSAMISLLALFR
jgi:hypothetical protein